MEYIPVDPPTHLDQRYVLVPGELNPANAGLKISVLVGEEHADVDEGVVAGEPALPHVHLPRTQRHPDVSPRVGLVVSKQSSAQAAVDVDDEPIVVHVLLVVTKKPVYPPLPLGRRNQTLNPPILVHGRKRVLIANVGRVDGINGHTNAQDCQADNHHQKQLPKPFMKELMIHCCCCCCCSF